MAEVARLRAEIKDIKAPADIRNLPYWLCFRLEDTGDVKPAKVPYYASGSRRTGQNGSAEDRARLTTFDAAKSAAALKGMDGIGFALIKGSGITVIDADHCLTDAGIHPDVVKMGAGTYAEFSPSGEGVHIFLKGDLGDERDPNGEFGCDIFSSKGYVTFTGIPTEETVLLGVQDFIATVPQSVQDYVDKRFSNRRRLSDNFASTRKVPQPEGWNKEQIAEMLSVLNADMGRNKWRDIGMAIHLESNGRDWGFELWDSWSRTGKEKYPGTPQLRHQWNSFKDREALQVMLDHDSNAGVCTVSNALVPIASQNGVLMQAPVPLDVFNDIAVVREIKTKLKAANDEKYHLIPAIDYAGFATSSWLIKNFLTEQSFCVIYGESGSGKSFEVLDIGMSIARGVDWRGRKTQRKTVVYLVAEGAYGMRTRLLAYAQHHQIELKDVDFYIIDAVPNLLMRDDAVELAKSICQLDNVGLVIVDTVAQTTVGGNENSGEDVGKFISNCQGIMKATGASVMAVHHKGKDPTKGARGWSGLRAAVDTELEVERLSTGRVLRIRKQKEGQDFEEFGFDLDVVTVGFDEDGDAVTSCVVRHLDRVPVTEQKKSFGKWEAMIVKVVEEMAKTQSDQIDPKEVMDRVLQTSDAPEDGKRDNRKQHINRAMDSLCASGHAPFFKAEDGTLTYFK